MSKTSPFPAAYVARVGAPADGRKSAVLVPRHVGWLCVQLFYLGRAEPGLEVKFSEAGDDDAAGKAVGAPLRTDALGVARLDFMVPVGRYVCEIERQEPTVITTVPGPQEPHVLVLPIGRPHFDIDHGTEFAVLQPDEAP